MRVRVFRNGKRDVFEWCVQTLNEHGHWIQLSEGVTRIALAQPALEIDPELRQRWVDGERPNTHAWLTGVPVEYRGNGRIPCPGVLPALGERVEIRYNIQAGRFEPEVKDAVLMALDREKLFAYRQKTE